MIENMADNCRGPVLIGKVMNEGGLAVRGTLHSPDSDCNSNHRESVNCHSNTSSQDVDFIQDNSDYQWFLDYGYRDGGTINHHTSILSLPESYDARDIKYYDVLAKNMDANLAEVDIESFRTEDIHALLTTLPPMCTDHFSQENNRQGESYASVSGSLMAKFDFDSSSSPHSSSHCEDSTNSNSMSICKSELLFSPVKETPMPGVNFSVDSLDLDLLTEHDIMLTCQANKDNYTIAFEGSMTMFSEDSDYHETDKSEVSGEGSTNWSSELKTQVHNIKTVDASMSQSDSGSFTTWSKLKKRSSENQLRRHPSGNNNTSGDETSQYNITDNSLKSQSMPNLCKKRMRRSNRGNTVKQANINSCSMEVSPLKRIPVKVFDIQHQIHSSCGSGTSIVSEMATSVDGGSSASENMSNKQQNFSLVKLYMKQKSLSAEGMSVGMDQSSASENWRGSQSGESATSETKLPEQRSIHDSLVGNRILEEQENEISRSESVEQLSDSISKLESVGGSNCVFKSPPLQAGFNINNNNSMSHEEIQSADKLTVHNTKSKKNPAFEKIARNYIPTHLINKSIQTSHFAEMVNSKNYRLTSNSSNTKDVFKVVEPSFLSKLKKEGEIPKPVYVLYPSYALPDLGFLKTKDEDTANLFLLPQKPQTAKIPNKKRPFSCNDVEALKRKGFNHIQDWDSLNFLLPCEYRKILAGVPEVAQKLRNKETFTKQKHRPMSCDYSGMLERTHSLDRGTNISSSSSTATQPSSGYRGSSTMLTDSQNSPVLPTTQLNPLFVYHYDSVTSSEASLMASEKQRSIPAPPLPKRTISLSSEQANKMEVVPPRPPLPRGILRKSAESTKLRKHDTSNKRYSMFVKTDHGICDEMAYKRQSLQEPYYLQRNKRLSETEDEGVDAGTSSSSLDEHVDSLEPPVPPHLNIDFLSNISNDELAQLEEFLKLSGISTSDQEELDENGLLQLRSYVSRFASLKINQEGGEHFGGKKYVSFAEKINMLPKQLEPKLFPAPNNSPNVSAFVNHKNHQTKTLVDMPICEENEGSPEIGTSPQKTLTHHNKYSVDLVQKRSLINAVTDAVEQIIHHFSPATNQKELINIGDSSVNPACAKLALSALCPALYAILSDGLKPSLQTSFGSIPNSVWQVVESSAQQGPLTKALHELVMRINDEDVITEGLLKFNAFVFGLLNVRSLDAWASYLRTRESILRKHYEPDSLLLLSHTSGASVRSLVDTLIAALQPLALLPFQFDLLFEYRQLHLSLKRMDSYQQLLSPTKLSPSPNLKQWNTKLCLSANSNRSQSSDGEEMSTATVIKNFADYSLEQIPDILRLSHPRTRSGDHRPKSCLEPGVFSKQNYKLNEDVTSIAKKRWSGISLSSKLYQAYDRLAREDEEEYTDSLENTVQMGHKSSSIDEEETNNENISLPHEDGPESIDSNISDSKPLNGKRFKKLQRKWEMISGRESSEPQSPPLSPTHTSKSKIPRPLSSPVKPSGIPVPISTKKVVTPPANTKKPSASNLVKASTFKKGAFTTRTSRVDQLDNTDTQRHISRPSSLPYKGSNSQNEKASKTTPPRRAVSNSLNRKQVAKTHTPKVVRTISHRLPSESGHLSYNEGEKLRVVLEVDEKWFLCCRGTQKGLVSRSAVIADSF